MRLVILSDIHGNLSALRKVIEDFREKYEPQGLFILGDIINYGMRPNEVIAELQKINIPVIANIYGNHEKALFDGDTSHFSTERGKRLLEYTRSALNENSLRYIKSELDSSGCREIEIGNKKILAVHGSIDDPYWGKLNATTVGKEDYAKYDFVFSGHSHVPHLIENFYERENPGYRNKKRTIFINPGSVGQPRNHNPRAQYAYVDIEKEIFHFNSVEYDVPEEQRLYPDYLDEFYSKRLTNGI